MYEKSEEKDMGISLEKSEEESFRIFVKYFLRFSEGT